MKNAVIYLKDYKGKSTGDIERILQDGETWKIFLLSERICGLVSVPDLIKDEAQHLLYAELIPSANSYYSDGTDTYADQVDIPQVDDGNGNMIGDASFLYYPAVSEHWEIKLDQAKKDIEAAATLKNAQEQQYRNAINFGLDTLVEYGTENALMGITADGMTKTVRAALKEVTSALMDGSLRDAMDEIRLIPVESKDAKFITDVRLLAVVNKIEGFLGDALSNSL